MISHYPKGSEQLEDEEKQNELPKFSMRVSGLGTDPKFQKG